MEKYSRSITIIAAVVALLGASFLALGITPSFAQDLNQTLANQTAASVAGQTPTDNGDDGDDSEDEEDEDEDEDEDEEDKDKEDKEDDE